MQFAFQTARICLHRQTQGIRIGQSNIHNSTSNRTTGLDNSIANDKEKEYEK